MSSDEYCRRVMANCREFWLNTPLTLQDVADRMGYPEKSGRWSVSQFLNRTTDPRLSMLIRFADAIGCDVRDLLDVTDAPAENQ